MKMLKVLAIVLVVLIIIGGIVIGVAAYGYSNVKIQFSGVTGIQPQYATDLGSILAALGQVALGNWLGAAKQFVSGVTIEGTIDFINPNIIPLWIPTMEHKLYIGGESIGTTIKTSSMWLGARTHKSVPVRTTIAVDDLPSILVEYIYSGGSLDVSIESSIRMGTFSFSKTSKVTASVSDSITSMRALSVNFDGWYVNGSSVSTTDKGSTVTAQITISNGDPGQYTMRIRRDVSLSSDETVNELSFSYDGSSTSESLSFSPPYATNEASTNGYHIDLLKDGNTVWTLGDSYPPRLTVTTTSQTTTALSVYFDGWYVNGSSVSTTDKGSTVTAQITISNGDAGQYSMRIRRDVSLSSDETVSTVQFYYDGSSANKSISFTPPYATSEASTNGYHIDLLKDGNTVWTLGDSYPPRLSITVASTTPALTPTPTYNPMPTSTETTTIRFNVLTGFGQSGIGKVSGYIHTGENVSGSFTVTQGGSKDIIFYILGPTGTVVWGSSSGPRTYNYGTFSFSATQSGTYTLVFDNTFSSFTDKHITLQITGGGPWSLIEGAPE